MKAKIIIIVTVCIAVIVGSLFMDGILGKSYLEELSYKEFVSKLDNKDSFVLLISQTSCGHCAAYKPKLNTVAKKHKITIYYIDVDLLDEKDRESFEDIIEFKSTPVTIFIKNGEETTVANRINGNVSESKIESKLKSNGFITTDDDKKSDDNNKFEETLES